MNVIYRIRNVVDNRFYVGSTNNFKLRADNHRRRLRKGTHQSPKLQAAWVEYGEDCFKFEVLEEYASAERLREIEGRWLQEWHGRAECYNESSDACAPMRGKKHTPEALAKMALKTVHRGADHYRFGKTLSDEVKAKISAAQKGVKKGPRTLTPEGHAKILAAAAAGRYSHGKGRKRGHAECEYLRKRVIEYTTGMEFESLTKALEHFGLKMPTLTRALKTGRPLSKGPKAGLHFSYLTPPQLPATVGATGAETPAIHIYPDLGVDGEIR